MIFFDCVYIAEIKAIQAIPQPGAECYELSLAVCRIFVEKSATKTNDLRVSIPIFSANGNLHGPDDISEAAPPGSEDSFIEGV